MWSSRWCCFRATRSATPPPPCLAAADDVDALLDATSSDGDDVPWFNLDGMFLRCKVVAVYDGDTVTIVFPFEGKAWREKCRLAGIDTPEIRTKNEAEKAAALRARDWLRGEVLGRKLWVRCGRWDKFGRLLGTLYRERDDATTTQQRRPSLNDELIARRLAVAYNGGTKAAAAAAAFEMR